MINFNLQILGYKTNETKEKKEYLSSVGCHLLHHFVYPVWIVHVGTYWKDPIFSMNLYA